MDGRPAGSALMPHAIRCDGYDSEDNEGLEGSSRLAGDEA